MEERLLVQEDIVVGSNLSVDSISKHEETRWEQLTQSAHENMESAVSGRVDSR